MDLLALAVGTLFGTLFAGEIWNDIIFDLFFFEAVSRAAFYRFLIDVGCVVFGLLWLLTIGGNMIFIACHM